MSFAVVGHCPRCGAPIWAPMAWWAVTPPPSQYTCACFPQPQRMTAGAAAQREAEKVAEPPGITLTTAGDAVPKKIGRKR